MFLPSNIGGSGVHVPNETNPLDERLPITKHRRLRGSLQPNVVSGKIRLKYACDIYIHIYICIFIYGTCLDMYIRIYVYIHRYAYYRYHVCIYPNS